MKTIRVSQKFYLYHFIILIFLTSCRVFAINQTQTVEFNGTDSNTPLGPSTTHVSSERVPSATPTKLPSIAYQTPTSIQQFSPDQAFNQLLLHSFETCLLPCIWGITPGVTTYKMFENDYMQLGSFEFIPTDFGAKYMLEIPNSNNFGQINYLIASDFNVVTEMLISSNDFNLMENMNWWEAITHLGVPDNIYLAQLNSPEPDYHVYQLLISFASQGVYFFLDGDSYAIDEKTAQFCPLSKDFLMLATGHFLTFFPDPKRQRPMSELINFYDWVMLKEFDYYQTEMTNAKFFEKYLKNYEDVCFEVELKFDE
jgi:hypothetical protein